MLTRKYCLMLLAVGAAVVDLCQAIHAINPQAAEARIHRHQRLAPLKLHQVLGPWRHRVVTALLAERPGVEVEPIASRHAGPQFLASQAAGSDEVPAVAAEAAGDPIQAPAAANVGVDHDHVVPRAELAPRTTLRVGGRVRIWANSASTIAGAPSPCRRHARIG